MKLVYLIVALLLPYSVYSQMKVNAGNDTTFCESCIPDGTVRLGTTMKIENGTPPYTYKWTTKLNLFSNSYFYAKTFLNDTTVANPVVKEPFISQNWNPFYLEVMDANQQVARDTILIRFSAFGYLLTDYVYYARIGDEIEITDNNFFGGILPYKSYHWSPETELSNPDSLITKCKVTESIDYYTLTITDSVGCKGYGGARIRIITGINQRKEILYPVQKGNALVWNNESNQPVKLIFYRANGVKIKEVSLESNSYIFPTKLHDKIYYYQLFVGRSMYKGKFFNQ